MAMKIVVNGLERECRPGLTIAELLKDLGVDVRRVAVERNLEIVPRSRHAETPLAEGDKLEIVTFVGGGSWKTF